MVYPNRLLKNRSFLALKLYHLQKNRSFLALKLYHLQKVVPLNYRLALFLNIYLCQTCVYSHLSPPYLLVSGCHKLIAEAYNQPGGVQIAKARVDGNDQQQPPQPPDKPNWCICGRCRDMGESRENIC